MVQIQWYPGHIAKMERRLADLLKLVDVVVEVVDARIPQSTVNERLRKRMVHKPGVVVLNKADLGDPQANKTWVKHYRSQGSRALLYEAMSSGKHKKELLDTIIALGEERMKALEGKGMKRRPIRTLIIGMPNVGKSSIINNIVGKKKTQTGHKAGVTRQPQWVRIHPDVELLDSPGIIPPVLDSEEVGLFLATVSSVGEAAFDDETVARFLLAQLETHYPKRIREVYKIGQDEVVDFEAIAQSRHFLAPGGKTDHRRSVQAVLSDFRQGRLGRLTLEFPPRMEGQVDESP